MSSAVACQPDRLPAALRRYPHWVVWREEPRAADDPRPAKIPYGKDGAKARANAPGSWLAYEDALALYQAGGWNGLGFFFWRALPYIGIDLDHCRDAADGTLDLWARQFLEHFPGAYVEASQSGTGLHIIVQGKLDFPAGREGGKKGPVEIYAGQHYLALTGVLVAGAGTDVTAAPPGALEEVARAYGFLDRGTAPLPGAPDAATPDRSGQPDVPAAPPSGEAAPAAAVLTDDDLVTAIMRSPDAKRWHKLFGGGELPGGSASEADFEMASILCRHSTDDDQVARLMELSPLKREKWRAKRGTESWLQYTIRSARLRLSGGHAARVIGSATAVSLATIMKDPNALNAPPAVIPNLAWAGRMTLVAAREGIGKSTLFAAAAAAVTTGGPWLGVAGQEALRCAQGAVLWCLVEEHVGDLGRRAIAMRTDPDRLYILDRPGDALAALRAETLRLKPALIIIDTLHAWAAEAVTETASADEWQPLMTALDSLARSTGVAILMAAQASKQTGDYRDSTAIGHAVDVVLTLARPSDLPEDDPTRDLLVRKARWSLDPVRYRYTVKDDLVTLEGLTKLPPAVLDAARATAAYDWIKANPGKGLAQLARGIRCRPNDAERAASDLVTSGRVRDVIEAHGDQKWHRYYVADAVPADAAVPATTDKGDRDDAAF